MQQQLPFEYDGKAGAIITKIAKYAFFNLITLFIYRFWAKTHLRRYFWSSVRLDGESFAYHGTGKELFIGFVIFFCLFFVFYIVNELVLFLLAGGWLHFIYTLAVALGFIYLFHLAVFRMLKYRLSRTSWKGVRFGLDGKGRHYAWRALLLMILSLMTLGIAYPWVRAYLINYRLKRARFGSGEFDSALTGGRLAIVYYISQLPWLLVLGSIAYFAFIVHSQIVNFADQDYIRDISQQAAMQNLPLVVMFFGGLVAAYVLKIVYRVFEAKAALSHLQFQNITFNNHIAIIKTALIFTVLSVLYYILTLFALLCVGFIIGVNYWLFPLIYVIYVVYLFATIALTNWIVARLIVSASLHGDTGILQDVSSYRKDEPTHGEGLFEILDIGNI